MAQPGSQVWSVLAAVRPAERPRFRFFVSISALISFAQILGLAGSEALFLARFGVAFLPHTFVLAALATVVGTLLYAARVGSMRNDRIFTRMLGLAALVLAGATLGVATGADVLLPGLLCVYFLTQCVFLNHFWTFATDYFDILASKRLFPLFTAGASAGGFLGGLAAAGLSRIAPPETLIAAWSIALLATALVIRAQRGKLRRWGPLEAEEKDETSLAGMAGATRYVARSALGRWMVVSAAGMVTALFVGQYLYSEIFVRSFPTAEALAVFFGLFLALTNLGELAIEFAVTPWLIRRLGVAGAGLVHPVLTLLTFVALALDPRLSVAALTRMNREMLDNALSGPIRNLTYNAMVQRFRGRVRALVEGMVVHAAMAVAGIALLLNRGVDARWLYVAGGGMALVYLIANLRVRHEYIRELVRGIREGRLDLAEVGGELAGWEESRVAALWESALSTGGAHVSASALQLAPVLARRGITEPLVRGTSHREPDVRRACLEALGDSARGIPEACLAETLADSSAEVRRSAVRAVARRRGAAATDAAADAPSGELESGLRRLLDDGDPRVRAEAALALREEGRGVLEAMARSDEAEAAAAALGCLPPELGALALDRADSPDPQVRAAALAASVRLSRCEGLGRERLTADLRHDDPRVRAAAVMALGTFDVKEALEATANALSDANREVRSQAVRALGEGGPAGRRAAEPYLSADSEAAARAAVEVLAADARAPGVRARLVSELESRVRQAWNDSLALRVLPENGDLSVRFLRAAHADSSARNQRIAFAILASLEDRALVGSVERALRHGRPRARADALEVLSHLGDRDAADLLVLLLEEGSIDDKLRAAGTIPRAPHSLDEVIDADRRAPDAWIRMGAHHHRREAGESISRRETMERLILLREVSLFARLTLDQLEAIDRILTESQYVKDEIVVREGDPSDELYLLVEGEVDVVSRHGTPEALRLNTIAAPGYFGEMAILDDQPRSATIVVTRDTRLLSLRGDSFKDLMLQMPEIAFEICRELTARIRRQDRAQSERAKRASQAGTGA